MLKLDVTTTDRGSLGGVAGQGLDKRISIFIAEVNGARQRGAIKATNVSRANVRRIRPLVQPRAGRYHGLKDAIRWRPIGGGDSAGVGLALQELNAKFPPWLVQEIGTGQRGIQRVGGSPNPAGRPTKGATYVKTVKSQVGRRLSPGLVWASGGRYESPRRGAGRTGQIVPRAQASGAPARFDRVARRSQPGIRISREIRGQHFIQKGGQAGFREYRGSVLTAARSQLKKRKP